MFGLLDCWIVGLLNCWIVELLLCELVRTLKERTAEVGTPAALKN